MTVKRKILIVDDEPDMVENTRLFLDHKGHEVLSAFDGEEGLRIARQERPDIILLDVMMPKINGYQVCRELKGDAETKSIPIIMLTAKAQESDKSWGKEVGADNYVTKPFEMNDLIQKIEDLLKNRVVTADRPGEQFSFPRNRL